MLKAIQKTLIVLGLFAFAGIASFISKPVHAAFPFEGDKHFVDGFYDTVPPTVPTDIEIKCHGVLPMPKWYEKEIRKKLRAAWKLMQERRADGERGRLDFESPY